MTIDISAAFFFPYLGLSNPIQTREWVLGGLEMQKPGWKDTVVGQWVFEFVGKLRGPNEEAEIPATLVIARSINGKQPSNDDLMNKLYALSTAVQFSAILSNCSQSAVRWSDEGLVTTENCELRVVRVDTCTRMVYWPEGFIQRRLRSLKLDDVSAVFDAPGELHSIPVISLDVEVLESVYDLHFETDPTSEQPQRILGAIHWYLKSWTNSRNSLIRDRIFYLKTGLDALAGTDKTQKAIPVLRGLYESRANNQDLLWTDSAGQYQRIDSRGNKYSLLAFDHWYWELSAQRNMLIHESSEPSWQYNESDSIYNGGYFETAERVLRELVLIALDEFTTKKR